jgi:drug/metabolite transporter (DMT)-like permease
MSERAAVLLAMISSALGGLALAVTRFVIEAADPVTLGAFRYGGGAFFLLPLAMRRAWPRGRDWVAVLLLGLLFFGAFPVIYNLALANTTAARGALALSTLPLLTMLVAALFGVEALSRRKTAGVMIAVGGVATALAADLAGSPAAAWRGDLLMLVGALAMAVYNVFSRPFIARSSALGFTAAGMAAGALCLASAATLEGGFAATAGFGAPQWLGMLYLAAGGGALGFYLWGRALEHTTPTRVANTLTLNPIVACAAAAMLLGEPVGLGFVLGVTAVFGGIWVATSGRA